MRNRPGQIAPPGGAPLLRSVLSQRAPADAEKLVCAALGTRLGADHVSLHRSGREALRVALRRLASNSGRNEVIIPAYTCFSVPAAAVAAGLRVRLVEADPRGRIDPVAFGKLPLERAAAVVVCNLFGHCESIQAWSGLAEQAGVAVVDDAAQALGATSNEGAAGSRGAAGILSFGRGKPLAALGGGACAWHEPSRFRDATSNPSCGVNETRPNALRAVAAAALHDVALRPWVFRQLKRVPALGIGETHFDPDFARGEIHGECLALANTQLRVLDQDAERRRATASALVPILRDAGYEPLAADPGSSSVYPRLAVLARTERMRTQTAEALAEFGAGRLYPNAVADIEALRSELAGSEAFPVAADFAARLFTMRTTRPYSQNELDRIAITLEAVRV